MRMVRRPPPGEVRHSSYASGWWFVVPGENVRWGDVTDLGIMAKRSAGAQLNRKQEG